MAVAPLNKFITVAVPVAPKQQKIYETSSGSTAILLYASVANVAGITTYPKVTFTHRRESLARKTSGNVRNIRVLKDVEIPPNDSLVIIDGRLVLERTATIIDSVIIEGNQNGVLSVTDVDYDNTTGIATISTQGVHGFSAGDEITLSNIYFDCTYDGGPNNGQPYPTTTSNIFPNPQKSFIVDYTDGDPIGISTVFTTNVGTIEGITHTYAPAKHTFVRSTQNSITVSGGGSGPFTPTAATYDGSTGNLVLTVANHQLQSGINADNITIATESLTFTCTSDGNVDEIAYPRSGDPAAGASLEVTDATTDTFTVNVGRSPTSGYVAPLQMEFICSILENSSQ